MEENRPAIPEPPLRESESRLAIAPNAGGTTLALPPPSHAERAVDLFAEEVGRLPGVLRVEQWGAEGSGAPTFHVYLRPDDRDTEYAVYEVKGQVYDRYPEAYLDVVVLETTNAPLPNGEPSAWRPLNWLPYNFPQNQSNRARYHPDQPKPDLRKLQQYETDQFAAIVAALECRGTRLPP